MCESASFMLGSHAMIHETATNLDPGWGQLIDVDVLNSGEWTGLFRNGEQLTIRTAQTSMPAPAGIRFPLIRSLDPERCVLVDTRTQKGRANGWIVTLNRGEFRTFFAGDGVQDVLAQADSIVVTYFDEGVFSGIKPGAEGVVLFSGEGQFQAGYRSLFGAKAVDIADCYAACWENEFRIAFLPYPGFPLVRWDLRSMDQTVEATPRAVHGASAMSISDDTALFYGPYEDKSSIFAWRTAGEASSIARHSGPLRGLPGGRFLTHGTSGFTVVEAAHEVAAAEGAAPRS